MHENKKIRTKWGIKWSYRHWGRKTLQKFRKKMTKKSLCCLAKSERDRKVWKNFWKGVWINQRTVLKNLKHDVQMIEKQVRLIKQGRGSLNFLNKILIDRKSDWINRNYEKTAFYKNNLIFENFLKALNIRNKNAWVWDEMLFQNTRFKPNFSRI